ncbi:dihydroxyacetone kinase family protein [Thermasporomyces composti]|uniref:Homodimeric dihydroxyacetone kinase n=1 Tax=Thermasporomyces composti TaxID=696763 RepID=A0A3D9V8E0_THECX|nr:dihydroxyacetone kinase family protein [Thermasporomyces composti]REF36973.1 homodimeric dihydroxyacetone kinase [Thermasporomyces composti]
MTRLYNDPARFKDDMVEGFLAAYSRYVERVPDTSGVMRAGGPRPGKVSVIVGGGSGHYPAFCGLVGPGLADGAVIGDIFTSPSTQQAYRVGKALDGGAGVLFSYGNYAGDVMNFGLAEQRLRDEGIDCRTVLVTDDIASAPSDKPEKRRGIAGDFVVFKVAGAAAERGDSIDEVERLARKANDLTRTIGVAFAGCTFPGKDEPLFRVDPTKMELGLGIHGEPGVRTTDRLSAAELAGELVSALLAERPDGADGRAAVILNGLGATKYEELFVLWKDVVPRLREAGVELILPEVGELVTSLDMAGCSLTICWLDDELTPLWEAPADTPAFRRGSVSSAFSTGAGASTGSATSTAAVRAARERQAERRVEEASPQSREVAATVRRALDRMLEVIRENEARLGEIDAIAGDGDHGRGMVRGLTAACGAANNSTLGAGQTLRAAGEAWADSGGGSSGVLWGALLQAIGRVIGDQEVPDARTVVAALREATDAVTRLGGANVGDKTLLDALVPFVTTLDERVAAGEALGAAWRRAAEEATAAAERTRELVPKVGRARPLADKSVGNPDPGAVSLALCLTAVGEVLSGGEQA